MGERSAGTMSCGRGIAQKCKALACSRCLPRPEYANNLSNCDPSSLSAGSSRRNRGWSGGGPSPRRRPQMRSSAKTSSWSCESSGRRNADTHVLHDGHCRQAANLQRLCVLLDHRKWVAWLQVWCAQQGSGLCDASQGRDLHWRPPRPGLLLPWPAVVAHRYDLLLCHFGLSERAVSVTYMLQHCCNWH